MSLEVLIMNLQEFQDKLDKDVKIDGTKLQWEASNNPVVYAQWLRAYSDVKKQIMLHEHKKKIALKERLDFYTGRGNDICPDMYEKSEMKTVLAADESISSIEIKLQMYQIMLDFCSKALDIIKARGFSIKNMIEIRTMENGG